VLKAIQHIRRRRADLRAAIDLTGSFEAWEETCVPSYCHRNWAAAGISWLRLFVARRMAADLAPRGGKVLDFGSSVGEMGHLIEQIGLEYHFIELDEKAAAFLQARIPNARRETLEAAPPGGFNVILAIDSLEHNDDFDALLQQLATKLTPDGTLILSGPTENFLYRAGRAIAGFHGHYHHATIFDIERAAAKHFRLRRVARVLPLLTLFRVTAWQRR
jgi:2-polyprenyl-3-methyl-5-hydroxy-6-metoxy-1,4-benzoquinol methylase